LFSSLEARPGGCEPGSVASHWGRCAPFRSPFTRWAPAGSVRSRRLAIALAAAVAIAAAADAAIAEDWPQHLGPRRDGASSEPPPPAWPAAGPAVLWRHPVGESFAAPVVAGDRVFVFHRVGDEARLDCLRAADGKVEWTHRSPTRYRDDFGFSEGPRATPAVTADSVFLFGADGELEAVDRATGARRWIVATQARFGAEKGFFGAASSPLVVGNRLYLNVGGKASGVVAFDTADGKVVWATGSDDASYSSGVATSFAGRAAILFFTREGVVLAAADDGATLARYPLRSRNNSSVNAATPLLLGDRIFASASYGTGAVLLATASGKLEPVWSSDEALSSHYATSVAYNGLLFGFHGRQEYGPSLRAIDAATGKVRWSIDRFGAGSITRVDDHLLVLHEDGRLFLARASAGGFEPIAQARILVPTVRALPAYADGVLYAHNEKELIAVRLR
jgi:outer membrane protein assembly factor BamB